jgi:redox-sensitive bicupin YhaK (pirin superfamily)
MHMMSLEIMNRPGFHAKGLRAEDAVLDPLLMIDHYKMSQPVFGAHPHAGFSAVTYMFDDAETGFQNHDSLGDRSIIRPGDAHWSIAGRGIVHDEVPVENGKVAYGLQMFVNLAAVDELQPARSLHFQRESMPQFKQAHGAKVKLAFGRYDDGLVSHSLGDLPTEVSLFDVKLAKGSRFAYPAQSGLTVLLVPIAGALIVNGAELKGAAALDHAEIDITSTDELAQFVLLLGTPLKEPVFRRGPFALSTLARLHQAVEDFQQGKMGTI